MRQTLSTLTLAAAFTAAAVSPMVAADGHQFEISGGAVYQDFDGDRNIDNDSGFGVGLGYVLDPTWTIETWYTEVDTDSDNSGPDVDVESIRLDALYHLKDQWGAWRPFLVAGLGDASFDPDNASSDDETRLNLGVGVKRALSEHFDFRSDLRLFNSLDEEETDLGLLLALTYKLGKTAMDPKPAERLDSDGDGVYDDEDQCPGTASNLAVDSKGCPMMLTEKVSIELKVNFDNDSAVVKESYMSEIKRVADFMAKFVNTSVEIQEHTDSRGSAQYNKALSQRRADSVAAVLVQKFGVAADRVSAMGYGEEQPIASNEAIEGRAANRRVVAEIGAQVESAKQR